MDTIQLTPDFKFLFSQFEREAKNRADTISRHLVGTDEQRLETVRHMQSLMAALNICAQSIDDTSAVGRMRDLMECVTASIQKQADAIDNLINTETCPTCGRTECEGDCKRGLL